MECLIIAKSILTIGEFNQRFDYLLDILHLLMKLLKDDQWQLPAGFFVFEECFSVTATSI
jgi:hypothetical protein